MGPRSSSATAAADQADAEPAVAELATSSSGIVDSVASGNNGARHLSRSSLDGSLSTWWGANGIGQWVRYDLGSSKTVDAVSLAWYRGDHRKATFDLALSSDGNTWTTVLSRATSSGSGTGLERYNVPDQQARYVRVLNWGNTENTAIGITEAAVHLAGAGDQGGAPSPVSSGGKAYYVDCQSGNDADSGASESEAWRSLSKVNSAWVSPGERVLLKRGCTWTGPLKAHWSGTASAPITIDAYGSGSDPLIRNGQPGGVAITGQYQIIQHLQVTADKPAPYPYAVRCPNTPMGWTMGFALMAGAHDNTVQYSKAFGMTGGAVLSAGSSHNKILHNKLVDNTVMSSNTNDPNLDNSGAWGVLINGDNNELAYNYFSGNIACSEKYTNDGATFEVYEAKGNYFHHNTSINDYTFTELGGKPDNRAENNTYAYNLYAPLNTPYRTGEFLVIRGWDSPWGANPGTKFYNNIGFNVNVGIYCGAHCDESILSAYNNIIVSRADATKAALWTDGAIKEGNNIYWRNGGKYTLVTRPGGISPTSKIADPKLADPWQNDFRLQADSPAVNLGVAWPVQQLRITADLEDQNNIVGGDPDAGPLERQ